MNKKIAFVGAGSIAEAIVSGIINAKVVPASNLFVTNRENTQRLEELSARYQVNALSDREEVISNADIVVLAMKPYDLEQSLSAIKGYLKEDQFIISILAGVSTERITELAGINIPVVRVMPNTSAFIGFSATALSKGKFAKEEHLLQAEQLFQTVGTTVLVPEKDMHTITAISGSGPAYIYYIVEAMEKAAIEAGLDSNIAKELITQTVIGAGNMLKLSGEEPDILRKKITSPKGTTEAGIEILEKHHVQRIMMECVKSAKERSEELGK
ncbi:pyrroline-5-carboxylate reductase [Oceanobacillus piezotolerans]|uniref:Pyrroline-5-carboxylate reductase n=1 Tax=Oceanobacillus piezotolerans TaxID=2448030 RepID=A0A498D4J6_9BACI|nr:pyrroline-5-carboxylate reductase [Oceanobacillus piezotolerans]RLL41721.1 pyrroline-5-carboxylate reductase [Oceanobacillus piezotolerans]